MNLRLHQLRALTGVVDYGGIRAASRHLHLSQAALTKALRELEDDAGCALLVRSVRGVQLTEAGLTLLARARLVVRQIELAEHELSQASARSQGQVRVALTPYVALGCFAQAFTAFRHRYPRVELELSEGLIAQALPRLRDGSLDWAVAMDNGDLPLDELHTRHLADVPQHIVLREHHPARHDLSPARFATLEWLLAGPNDSRKVRRVQHLFAQAGMAVTPQVLHSEPLAGLNLLRHADVMGLLPAPLLGQPEARGLVAVNVPGLAPPPFRLMLMSRPDVPLTAPATHLADCLEGALKKISGAP
jgi:LysR family transcriptional regulator, regulator of abg operon